MIKLLYSIIIIGVVIVLALVLVAGNDDEPANQKTEHQEAKRVQISEYNPAFRFSAEIPRGFQIEYVPEIESINIYDPSVPGTSARGQSRVFIRYFVSDRFETLSTVTILERNDTKVRGYVAVRYVIEKKLGIADFPHQPPFRNARHELVDVRLFPARSGPIYVIARSPEFSTGEFKSFLDSVQFHNDTEAFAQPIERAGRRVTKKPFGIFVEPGNSPVDPEPFRGYHTAVDYEIFDGEEDADVPVHAICGGPVIKKETARGYGGMVVQRCDLGDQPITVVYGHIRLSSMTVRIGDYLAPETRLAILGTARTEETGGERKHLHLGIHRGMTTDTRGYVSVASDLKNWIDPYEILPKL